MLSFWAKTWSQSFECNTVGIGVALCLKSLALRLLLTFNERAMLTEDVGVRRLQVAASNAVDCSKIFTTATMNLFLICKLLHKDQPGASLHIWY